MAPKKNGDHDEKQHIQVVVRCRPLNNTEKKQGAFNIIEVNQEKKEICVKDRPSSSGPMKKFVFDHVFGPRATQMEVYKVTVLPVIEEVLQGYNCTIFAYGQTGSGKTYTMEGEKTENCSWNDDPLAGVIPRAMSQLFSRLNDMDVEYVIRVSYLEIYNEELIDLLGAETDENPKLRIYDDSSRKGSLVITGLEDLPVRSKYEVYQILERGSQRRQTAATNMNAHSSRSHSLFMVSVHMKDTSVDGEELLKVGKLNLVDLAGSECIGRSGAVDKRAREAGNINQSLLTLGRVITALVEHAPHIPYRESKLTRLLKDSLGGHTKTSVIATITPASTFLEETLSTLEYAHRTRNITNKPEINQKLSKTTMLKSYAEEIEKLKKELQAARDKSGVYLPTDSYEEMVAKLNLQQEAIKNYEEEISCLTSEMQKINELFAETREKLEDTTKQLGDTRQTLHVTKKERDEQKHLVKHHVKTEHVLHKQASQLLQTAEESTSDVSGLHAKLDRKRNVEKHNEQVQEQFREKFHGDIERMQNSLKSYSENQIKSLGTIESDLGNLVSRSLTDMKGLSKGINHVINLVTGQVTELHESQDRYSKDDKKWAENLTSFCSDSLHGEITRQSGFHRDTFLTVMASIHEITSRIATNLNDICENLEAQLRDQKKSIENFKTEQLDSLNKLKEAGTEFANQQINTTRSHVASAQKTYKSQIEQNELFAEKMRQNVNEMITNMLLTQNNHLKSNIDQLSENLTESCEKEEQFLETLTRNVENMEQLTEQGCSQLSGRCTEDNTHTKQAAEQFKSEVSVLEEKIASLENEMEKFTSVGTEVCTSVSDQIADMIKTHIDSVEGQFSSHQTATKTLTTECSHALEELDSVQTKQNIELTETIQSQQTTLENCCKQTADWSESHTKELESRKQSLVQFFLEEVKKDVPTGTTPERRQFSYPRTLAKTENHSVLLEVFHTEMMMNQATDTPLPLSDSELDTDDAESDTAVSVGNHLDISDDSSVKSGSVTSDQDFMLDNKENEIIPDNTGHIKQMKCNHAENAKNGVTQNGVRSTRKRRQMKLLN